MTDLKWRLVIGASEVRRLVITEKAPTRAFSWLKAATTAFTAFSVITNLRMELFGALAGGGALEHRQHWQPLPSAQPRHRIQHLCRGLGVLLQGVPVPQTQPEPPTPSPDPAASYADAPSLSSTASSLPSTDSTRFSRPILSPSASSRLASTGRASSHLRGAATPVLCCCPSWDNGIVGWWDGKDVTLLVIKFELDHVRI